MLRFPPDDLEQPNPFAAVRPYVYRQKVFKTFSNREVQYQSAMGPTDPPVADLGTSRTNLVVRTPDLPPSSPPPNQLCRTRRLSQTHRSEDEEEHVEENQEDEREGYGLHRQSRARGWGDEIGQSEEDSDEKQESGELEIDLIRPSPTSQGSKKGKGADRGHYLNSNEEVLLLESSLAQSEGDSGVPPTSDGEESGSGHSSLPPRGKEEVRRSIAPTHLRPWFVASPEFEDERGGPSQATAKPSTPSTKPLRFNPDPEVSAKKTPTQVATPQLKTMLVGGESALAGNFAPQSDPLCPHPGENVPCIDLKALPKAQRVVSDSLRSPPHKRPRSGASTGSKGGASEAAQSEREGSSSKLKQCA